MCCPPGHKGPGLSMWRSTACAALILICCLDAQGKLQKPARRLYCGCRSLRTSSMQEHVRAAFAKAMNIQKEPLSFTWHDIPPGTWARLLQQDNQAQQQPYSAPQYSTSNQVCSRDTTAPPCICCMQLHVPLALQLQLLKLSRSSFLPLLLMTFRLVNMASDPPRRQG